MLNNRSWEAWHVCGPSPHPSILPPVYTTAAYLWPQNPFAIIPSLPEPWSIPYHIPSALYKCEPGSIISKLSQDVLCLALHILLLPFRTPTRKELVPDLSRMPGWKTEWSSHRTQALPACPFVLPWMSVLPSPSPTNKYLANILLQNFNFSFSPPTWCNPNDTWHICSAHLFVVIHMVIIILSWRELIVPLLHLLTVLVWQITQKAE